MKRQITRLLVGVLTATFVAMLTVPARSQDRPGGLLGAFSGDEDPDVRPAPAPAPKPAATPAEARPQPVAPVVNAAPDTKALDERIATLGAIEPNDVKPVATLAEVTRRMERLRRRAERMRILADERTAETVKAVTDRGEAVREKWPELTKALADGEKRSMADWVALAERVRGKQVQPDSATAAGDDAGQAADEAAGLGGPDQPSAPPADGGDPLRPVEAPKAESAVTAPDLSDLARAIENQAKPPSMHPLVWARLLDEFEKDRAELELAVADARKRLRDRREDEYAPVARALAAAQRAYEQVRDRPDRPSEAQRRQLAWRMLQADLAQMRLARDDMAALTKERRGQSSARVPLVEMYPLDPARTLQQLARAMQVAGEATAPAPNAFDALGEEGLPSLYPPEVRTVVNGRVQYGRIVRANINRYQRMLRDVNRRLVTVDRRVAREDLAGRRRKAAGILRIQRLAGVEDHPISKRRVRLATQDLRAEQDRTRPDRIAKRTAELEKEKQAVLKRLEAEYKRRDAILDAAGERLELPETKPAE